VVGVAWESDLSSGSGLGIRPLTFTVVNTCLCNPPKVVVLL